MTGTSDPLVRDYLDRLGLPRRPADLRPDLRTLGDLHERHVRGIPFENIDLILGRPVRLDVPHLANKLIARRRGGYCFEHNLLFAAVLRAIGFHVDGLAARICRPGSTAVLPRTHVVLRVPVAGRTYLVDVGLGGPGPLRPLELTPNQPVGQDGWHYRLVGDRRDPVLQVAEPTGWRDLYALCGQPQQQIDHEVASYYVSTHPDSVLRRAPLAFLAGAGVRYSLVGRNLRCVTPSGADDRVLRDRRGYRRMFAEVFGLDLPALTCDRLWAAAG
jgi:N-hydroxyarylamine O-acetyltransferase